MIIVDIIINIRNIITIMIINVIIRYSNNNRYNIINITIIMIIRSCQISLLQRGVKGETVTAYTRVEFGKVLGETNKAELGPDGMTKFNFNTNIEVNLDDPSSIDEISHRFIF